MTENERIPLERRLADPLVRKDGIVLDMHINDEEGFIRVSMGNLNVTYVNEEVVLLGRGNFELGIRRVIQAYCVKPISTKDVEDEDRAYEGEIIKARASGKLPLLDERVH